jgi:hypothetical protein
VVVIHQQKVVFLAFAANKREVGQAFFEFFVAFKKTNAKETGNLF